MIERGLAYVIVCCRKQRETPPPCPPPRKLPRDVIIKDTLTGLSKYLGSRDNAQVFEKLSLMNNEKAPRHKEGNERLVLDKRSLWQMIYRRKRGIYKLLTVITGIRYNTTPNNSSFSFNRVADNISFNHEALQSDYNQHVVIHFRSI